MNVLVFTNMWPSPGDPYGTFVAAQVDDLRAAGAHVSVLEFDARGARGAYLTAARELRRRVAAEQPDLVHAHYGLTGFVAQAERAVPTVTTFHGSDAHVPWQRRLSRIAARNSTPVAVSREIAELIRRPDAAVIPMGVDTDHFRPMPRSEARETLGLDPARRYVLFPAGRSNAIKRYDLFAAAIAGLEVEGLPFEGYSRDEARLLLNAVDALLLTSAHEGSPVTVREALACDTPVVSVSVGDVAETLSGLPGCAVVAADPARLASAVELALDAPRDGTLRERALGSSRPAIAARLLELYGRLA
ncbi:MAG: glycosyltransferase [Actinobacteria bacterium]|nr:glycosyltransferase [Actinomycetota bacterium]